MWAKLLTMPPASRLDSFLDTDDANRASLHVLAGGRLLHPYCLLKSCITSLVQHETGAAVRNGHQII